MKQKSEQVNWKAEHQSLNIIIDKMQSQNYLSTDEHRVLKKLKKRRLRAKDKLTQKISHNHMGDFSQPQACS